MTTAPYTNSSLIPSTYQEEDTPRRFKDLLKLKQTPKKGGDARKVDKKESKNDIWAVRAGESFQQFNARIKAYGGDPLPPGVPRPPTLPSSNHTQQNNNRNNDIVQKRSTADPMLDNKDRVHKTNASAFSSSPSNESSTRKTTKRKAYREKKKAKQVRKRATSPSSYGSYGVRGVRDVVKAPPSLLVTPKATLKGVDKKAAFVKKALLSTHNKISSK